MPDQDEPLGLAATCSECGGDNRWTKNTRVTTSFGGLGTKEPERTRERQIICMKCRRTEWIAIGDA
jgi:hypothetical protein